ncbi:MAG: transposase [Blastocatellales bacterium]|nr:transposase [Blastocatellales bacterium]
MESNVKFGILGLDEISCSGKYRVLYLIVSTQDKNGTPVLAGRAERAREKDGGRVPEDDPGAIARRGRGSCSDLYEGFITAVEEVLPNAKVVADRFHVAKLYRAAVTKLRKIVERTQTGAHKEEYAGLKGLPLGLCEKERRPGAEERETLDLL